MTAEFNPQVDVPHDEHVVVEETKTTEVHNNNGTFKEQVARAVAVLGLVAVLLLGAWGIIQIAFNLPGFLAKLGSGVSGIADHKTESLVVKTPATVTSSEPATISWTHTNKGSGNYLYQLSYSCTDGLVLFAPAPNGSLQPVPCATPFNYTNAVSQLTLTPKVTGTKQLSTTITVAAVTLADGAATATGTSTLVVLPERAKTPATTVKKPTTSTSSAARTSTSVQTQNRRYSNPNGLPDLAIQILSVAPAGNDLYAVRFVVENVGTKLASSGWTFAAQLPVGFPYTYYAQPQPALYPGDKIVYTLTFEPGSDQCGQVPYPVWGTSPCTPTNGVRTINIEVDSPHLIAEITKSNNTAQTNLPTPY